MALVSRAAGIQVPEQHLPAECRGHGRGPTRDQSLAKQAGPAALPTRVGSRGLGPREAFLLCPCFSAVAHKTRACAATGLCWAVPPSRLQEPSSASFSSPAAGPDRDGAVLTPQAQRRRGHLRRTVWEWCAGTPCGLTRSLEVYTASGRPRRAWGCCHRCRHSWWVGPGDPACCPGTCTAGLSWTGGPCAQHARRAEAPPSLALPVCAADRQAWR